MKKIGIVILACMLAFTAFGCNNSQGDNDVDLSPAGETPDVGDDPPASNAPTPILPPVAPTPEPTPGLYSTLSLFAVECEDTINMRKEASSRAELLRTLPAGEQVRVIEYVQRYAEIEVVSTGEKGYVIAGYLKPEENVLGLEIVKLTANYTYEQLNADIAALQAAYPNDVQVEVTGQSVNGLDISVLILGNAEAEHHVFIQAAIHGREHMTTLLVMAQTEYWLKSGNLTDICFHVMPMANPDGVTISQEATYTDYLRQMYANDFLGGRTAVEGEMYLREWKANYNGVDLNRNFDAEWERINTSSAPSYSDYRGKSVASEPETQAIIAYTLANDFDTTISYHSTGSMIFHQFGINSPANEASSRLAAIIAEISAYTLEIDDGTSAGGYKDWAISQLSIPSLTIEIGTRAAPAPETDFYNTWLRNRYVFKAVSEWVMSGGAELLPEELFLNPEPTLPLNETPIPTP